MAEISVTIKGDGRDAAWVVVRGESASEVKALLADAYGLTPAMQALELHDIVTECEHVHRGLKVLSDKLGAKVESVEINSTPPTSGSVWDEVAQQRSSAPAEPQVDPKREVEELIAGCTTVSEIQALWSSHGAEIRKLGLTEAFTTKGAALKAAAQND